MLIISSFGVDFMFIIGLILFNQGDRGITSIRAMVSFSLFFFVKGQVQNNYLMQRLEGRLWDDPKVPSITIPYHNTNDFYFSGHLGINSMWLVEYYTDGYWCMFYYCCTLMLYNYSFMTSVRIHYVVDFIAGIIVGHWCVMQAEPISYYFDVKILGLSRKRRPSHVTEPCKRCGWNNWKLTMCIGEAEKNFLKQTYRSKYGQFKQ